MAIAATPLVWISVLHLAVGSAILGLIEGLALKGIFGGPWRRAVWTMVAANYVSMLLGVLVLGRLSDWMGVDLYSLSWAMWVVYGAAYGLTIVAEFPFVYLLASGAQRLRRAVIGSLVAQSVAGAVLALIYASVAVTPAQDGWKVVRPDELPVPEGVELYYARAEDGKVCRLARGMSMPQEVSHLSKVAPDDLLVFAKVEGETGVVELRCAGQTVQPAIRKAVAATPPRTPLYPERGWDGILLRGRISALNRPGARPPEYAVFLNVGALHMTDSQGRLSRHLAVGVPQFRWLVQNATQLPDGEVVMQLGRDQICLADPRQMKLTLLGRGQAPVPALVGFEPATRPALQQAAGESQGSSGGAVPHTAMP